jgi:hypothetical protein
MIVKQWIRAGVYVCVPRHSSDGSEGRRSLYDIDTHTLLRERSSSTQTFSSMKHNSLHNFVVIIMIFNIIYIFLFNNDCQVTNKDGCVCVCKHPSCGSEERWSFFDIDTHTLSRERSSSTQSFSSETHNSHHNFIIIMIFNIIIFFFN